ncbi:MAG: DUF2378 family protein [Myxococcota bacterium]|nr:DUF2378 family protein [Myxococcota bacterium]
MNPAERFVFAPTVEGLVRGVGAQLNGTTKSELRELGIDLDRPLKPGYPAVMWHRALEVIARDVCPGLEASEAHFRLGSRTVYGLDDTLVGKAMLAMIRLIGPRRTLLRLPTSAKIGTNFVGLTLTELAPNDFELVSRPFMGYAEVMQGSVHAVIEISGAPNPRVDIVDYDRTAEQMTLRAKWG